MGTSRDGANSIPIWIEEQRCRLQSWRGRLSRMNCERWAKTVLDWLPDGCRSRVSPCARWSDQLDIHCWAQWACSCARALHGSYSASLPFPSFTGIYYITYYIWFLALIYRRRGRHPRLRVTMIALSQAMTSAHRQDCAPPRSSTCEPVDSLFRLASSLAWLHWLDWIESFRLRRFTLSIIFLMVQISICISIWQFPFGSDLQFFC